LDPIVFKKELNLLKKSDPSALERILVARKAHLILPTHRYLDAASENAKGKEKIGSTLRGIGPTYMDKTGRNGLRVGDMFMPDFLERYKKLKEKHLNLLGIYPAVDFDLDKEERLWFESLEALKDLGMIDCEYYINEALADGRSILAEGAQGSMLDVDFGTYPFVTSSNTVASGVCNGLGVPPSAIGEVIGITKAYCTRVGSGPFPTQLDDEDGKKLQEVGGEFGATTGRPRRCGWIDLPQLRYTCMLNGVTQLAITKLDVLDSFGMIKAATEYAIGNHKMKNLPFDLTSGNIEPVLKEFTGWNTSGYTKEEFPYSAGEYIRFIEQYLNTPATFVSIGPERNQLIIRESETVG
jgi:adenylosuccinate synthase